MGGFGPPEKNGRFGYFSAGGENTQCQLKQGQNGKNCTLFLKDLCFKRFLKTTQPPKYMTSTLHQFSRAQERNLALLWYMIAGKTKRPEKNMAFRQRHKKRATKWSLNQEKHVSPASRGCPFQNNFANIKKMY